LLAWPETLAGAVLFRGATPGMPSRMPKLPHAGAGCQRTMRSVVQPEDTHELAALLRVAGADVSVALQPAAQQDRPRRCGRGPRLAYFLWEAA
jgi:hypothetical protein